MSKTAGIVALSLAMALGFGGAAVAAPAKHHAAKHGRYVTDSSDIGRFVLAPGDSRARVARSYPNIDANPPSLTGTYNLRGRTMQEFSK